MLRTLKTLLFTAALVASTALAAQADLLAVGPINLQNGFPLWWQDQNGTQVGICLEANCVPGAPPVVGNAFSQQIGFGAEAFWWGAAADLTNPVGVVLFELAMEAAFLTEDPAPGDQLPFVRLRARADAEAVGTYIITYPFGTLTVNVDAVGAGLEINETIDIPGTAVNIPPFSGALATGAPPVVADATQNGVSVFFSGVNPAPPAGFMGVLGAASTVAGIADPTVTIAGPAGAFGAVSTLTNNGLWDVTGKLFIPGVNVAPVAHPDLASTGIATPVTINVTANDLDVVVAGVNDHGINPRAVALGSDTVNLINNAIGATRSIPTAKGGTATLNADSTITYNPPPTLSGVDSFQYLVQDTGGLVASSSAIVTVEQATAQAAFRPKLQKWDISGTSSVSALTTTDAAANPVLFTNLAGVQEVPPRASAGTGDASVTLRPGADTILGTADDLIDYTLTYTGLVAVQQSHIHSGPVGANGPVNVFLCTNIGAPPTVTAPPACPATAGTVTGTLAAADFIAAGAVTTFPELIAAIQAGNTYVNVHTVAFGGGEIRGQLGRNVVAAFSGPNTASPVLGIAAVPPLAGQSSTWTLPEKLSALPSADRTVTIQTSAGNIVTVPLRLK